MTLRLKLFVLIGGLLALMVGAEWLLIETLTKDLRVEVTAVATSVGKDIVRILHPAHEKGPGLPAPHAPANEDEPAKRIVVTTVQTTGDGAISSTKSWTTAGGTGFLFIEGPDARARVRIPETGVKDAVTRFRTRLVLGSLGIVAVGLSVDELAARLPDDPGAAEMAAAARRQIAGVDGTIRSFLALAAEGGTVENVDVRELAEEVALSVLQGARGRVRVVVEAGEARPRICAVVPELRAALHVLVVNAVEASPEGARIAVRVEARDGGGARVTVDDEGPGLPGEVRSRLFTPHVTTKPSGSGMGLFLAHRIATTRYGGGLALEDRLPRGTRAVLDLGPRTGGRPG